MCQLYLYKYCRYIRIHRNILCRFKYSCKFVQNGETVITSCYKKLFDSFTRFLKLYHV